MTFDFFKTNEAKIKSFFGSCRKLKKQGSHFLQTLKSKKQGFYFFTDFEELKKQGFYFLQTWKAKKQGFFFFLANFRKLKKTRILLFANFEI